MWGKSLSTSIYLNKVYIFLKKCKGSTAKYAIHYLHIIAHLHQLYGWVIWFKSRSLRFLFEKHYFHSQYYSWKPFPDSYSENIIKQQFAHQPLQVSFINDPIGYEMNPNRAIFPSLTDPSFFKFPSLSIVIIISKEFY